MSPRSPFRRALDLDDEVGRAGRVVCMVVAVVLVVGVWPVTPFYPEPVVVRAVASAVLVLLLYVVGLQLIRTVRAARSRA